METFFIIITKSESAIITEFATGGEEVGFVFQSALNGTNAIIPKEAFVYPLADTPEWLSWDSYKETLTDILY